MIEAAPPLVGGSIIRILSSLASVMWIYEATAVPVAVAVAVKVTGVVMPVAVAVTVFVPVVEPSVNVDSA